MRVESGLAEYGLIVTGGVFVLRPTAACGMASSGRWRPIAPWSIPRTHPCSAILEDEEGQPEMWVMGGCDGDSVRAAVEAYNPRTNEWRSCLSLSQRRNSAVAGVVGGRLVVAGGFLLDDGSLTSVEAYTPAGWTALPPLPHATTGAAACVLNERLYVMGGVRCDKLQVLEVSEESEFSWTVKADLPSERHSAACVVFDGKIWLMGGRVPLELDADEEEFADEFDIQNNFTSSVIIYDPNLDSWEAGPDLPVAVSWCSATTHDGEIHVFAVQEGEIDETFSGNRRAEYHFVYQNDRWPFWETEIPSVNGLELTHFCQACPWLYPENSTCESVLLG